MFSTYLKDEEYNFALGDEEIEPPVPLNLPEYDEFAERVRKTLYYGVLPEDDRPSLPMSELAVEFFQEAAPKELGKVDLYWASDVSRKAFISPCSMMLSMIYIERLKHKNPEYLLTTSSSDLFLISMMVASKFLYDEGVEEEVYNEEWAESAAMDTADINKLERDFLKAIDWSLFAEKEDFERVLASMEERIAMSQGLDRGSWSYSDVLVMLSNAKLQANLRQMLEETLKVMLVCSVAYTAGGGTVVASVVTVDVLKDCVTNFGPKVDPHLLVANNGITQLEDQDKATEGNMSDMVDQDKYNAMLHGDESLEVIRSGHAVVNEEIGEVNTKLAHQLVSQNDSRSNANLEDVAVKRVIQSGLSFPSFLTLALIKDTVSHFLGIESNLNAEDGNVVGITPAVEGKRVICHCPTCPLFARKSSRRRKFIKGQRVQVLSGSVRCLFVPPHGLWSSLVHKYKQCCSDGHGKGEGQSKRKLSAGMEKEKKTSGNGDQGESSEARKVEKSTAKNAADVSGKVGNTLMWRDGKISGLNEKPKGDWCEVRDEGKWKEKVLLPCRIQQNHIEITSRWTSSPFAITR